MKNEQLEMLNQQSTELLRAAKTVFEEDIREKKKLMSQITSAKSQSFEIKF